MMLSATSARLLIVTSAVPFARILVTEPVSTEICPARLSRWSSRSGLSLPDVITERLTSTSCWASELTCPASAMVRVVAASETDCRSPAARLRLDVRVAACDSTSCRAGALAGEIASALHAFQNRSIWCAIPVSPGSGKAASMAVIVDFIDSVFPRVAFSRAAREARISSYERVTPIASTPLVRATPEKTPVVPVRASDCRSTRWRW
jgi:hypothetical protein